jgi:hypothetical protein
VTGPVVHSTPREFVLDELQANQATISCIGGIFEKDARMPFHMALPLMHLM